MILILVAMVLFDVSSNLIPLVLSLDMVSKLSFRLSPLVVVEVVVVVAVVVDVFIISNSF